MVIERIAIRGTEKLTRVMRNTKRASQNLKPYWKLAKVIVWKNTARRFKAGGGSKGKWAPLSEATPALRQFNKSSAAPLQDSGLLLKSVTTQESVKKESQKTLILGTNLRYADLQQEGFFIMVTPAMRSMYIARGLTPGPIEGDSLEVPGRPYLYIDDQDEKELGNALKFYFAVTMKKSGATGGL